LNDVYAGGHEGGETPFVLDVTDAARPGASNRLAVRVLNPTDKPIDGIVLAETPHRNKSVSLTAGCMYNSGGITESVELLLVPCVRVEDVFVRADWTTGDVHVQATVYNAGNAPAEGRIDFFASADKPGETVAATGVDCTFSPGDTPHGPPRRVDPEGTVVEARFRIENHRLWDLDDPYLYRLTARLQCQAGDSYDERAVRFGFRDFRVEKGYFRLNGRRVFLRSSHTGNHCPVGQILPPRQARDLLFKDLLYAKAAGFNAVRFIAGVAHPSQLDLCDEIGLMVYEESLAAWLLGDSPKMKDRFDRSTREMIVRDRNHPSVVIWGLLNETQDGPVFRHAVESLSLVRALDDTRLTLLGSGRWDGQFNIGSVSNPGSGEWEYVWGVEGPGQRPVSGPQWTPLGGYTPGAGDAHVYPGVPQTPEVDHAIRTLGQDTKPVFLSEYGIGSLNNAIRELRTYEQNRVNPQLDDVQYFRANAERFATDWTRLGFDGVYPFPEDMLRESQRLHCRQRLLGFDLIRSNPKICGYNLTGLLDHGFSGEGLWTFWREWKPGILDALQDGWAPVRWCLFAAPMHGYTGRPIRLEAVLANEDVLAPGEYPVTLRVQGPAGTAWEHKTSVAVPEPAPGEDGPLAIPVFAGEVVLAGSAGQYEFAACLESGGAPQGGRLKFYLSDVAALPALKQTAAVWGIDGNIQEWLASHGVACAPFEETSDETCEVVLVGDLSQANADAPQRTRLLRQVARGGVALFLSPQAFKRGEDPVGWLPLKNKGKGYDFPDWLYHKECVAKAHPVFSGLQARGIMDWDYYGPVIPRFIFEGQDTPQETMAAAFALCHSGAPGGYASGVLVAAYRFGNGMFILNTLKVLENIDNHPAADRLLLNLIGYAAANVKRPLVSLPADFDQQLKAVGYE
jgi:hypothetical protein